jgi:hypothetical protein
MAIEEKYFMLDNANMVFSKTNTYWGFAFKNVMSLQWTMNVNNAILSPTGSGDASMDDSIRVDGDLVLSVGWGDGFSVRRLGDNGVLSEIYSDTQPISGQSNYTTIGIDRVRKVAYVATHGLDNGYRVYDYSGAANGGTTVVKGAQLTTTTNNLPALRVGGDYFNGFLVVGDYLYMGDFSSTSTMKRWHIPTETADNLAVINRVSNGFRGTFFYDEPNNRVYCNWQIDGGFWLITNPQNSSTDPLNPAKCYHIHWDHVGYNNDNYTYGICPEVNNPNHLWLLGGNSNFAKVDISDILNGSGTKPVLLKGDIRTNMSGQNREKSTGMVGNHSMRRNPFLPGLMIISPDRGHATEYMWFDEEKMFPVGVQRQDYNGYYADGSQANTVRDHTTLNFDYSGFPVIATSANGTKYWVLSGFGGNHGYRYRSWPFASFPYGLALHTTGEIILGPFILDTNAEISQIWFHNLAEQCNQPPGTTLTIQISNDNQATWVNYNYNTNYSHVFTSKGNRGFIKFLFIGLPEKAPYIMGVNPITFTLKSGELSKRVTFVKHASKSIKGRKN